MSFSAFSRFGHSSFSSRELLGRKVYLAMRESLGPSFNQDFNDNPVQARLYAQAMGLARALYLLLRVKNQAIALKATDLLGALEAIYRIYPSASDTENERRRRLHARMQVSRGARRDAILDILNATLGEDFVSWVYTTADSLVRFPDTAAAAAAIGNDVPPGSQARVFRTLEPIFPGAQAVAVEELTQILAPDVQALVGQGFTIDPDFIGRQEHCTIVAAVGSENGVVSSLSATFANTHDPGVLITTQYFPAWTSNAQQHRFVATDSAATDMKTRSSLDEDLGRTLRAVTSWSIANNAVFEVGEGLIGITPIGS